MRVFKQIVVFSIIYLILYILTNFATIDSFYRTFGGILFLSIIGAFYGSIIFCLSSLISFSLSFLKLNTITKFSISVVLTFLILASLYAKLTFKSDYVTNIQLLFTDKSHFNNNVIPYILSYIMTTILIFIKKLPPLMRGYSSLS